MAWPSIRITGYQLQRGEYSLRVPKDEHLDLLKRWLRRAESGPWSLDITVLNKRRKMPLPGVPIAPDKHPFVLLKDLLLKAAPTLRRLRWVSISHSLGMQDLTFPNVVSVVANLERCGVDFDATDLPSMPSLRRLVITNHDHTNYLPSNIPWSNLTHLFLGDGLEFRQWKLIIKLCTMLEVGCFQLCMCRETPGSRKYVDLPGTTTLNHLRELTFLEGWTFEEDIPGLSLPALKKLENFTGGILSESSALSHGGRPKWHPRLLELFGTITHLNLSSVFSGTQLSQYLSCLPHLTEIFVAVFEQYDALLDCLHFRSGTENVPLLKTLGLYLQTLQHHIETQLEEVDSFPLDVFQRFVASRTRETGHSQLPARLEHLVIRIDKMESHPWVSRQLQDIIAEHAMYGLKGRVYQTNLWDEVNEGLPPYLAAPPPRHWDEGLKDHFHLIREFSGLYPRPSFGR